MSNIEETIKRAYADARYRFSGASGDFPISFFVPDDLREKHIEYDANGKISLVYTSRGKERYRKITYDVSELIYWLFRETAFAKAKMYEFKHRHPTDDPRRIWFPKAIEEIAKISPTWAKRMQREQDEMLKETPFNDDPFGLLNPDWTAFMPDNSKVIYEEGDSIFEYDVKLIAEGIIFFPNSARVNAGNTAPEPIHAVRAEEWLKKKYRVKVKHDQNR